MLDGYARLDSSIEVKRDGEIVATGKLARLQSGKQDVKQIETNEECGILFEGKPLVLEGDILQIYHEEKVIDKL